MSTTAHTSTDPADLEPQTNKTREELGRTAEALEERLRVKRKTNAASAAVATAADRVSKWKNPQITTLIRLDHTRVLAAFRRYRNDLPHTRKRAVVANVCLGLEIHTQLEEEIFYPALFAGGRDTEELDQSVGEHDQMRSLIERLRQTSPEDSHYDGIFRELIRVALHHIADEETMLLPWAEVTLSDQLRELGLKMTIRRFELLRPHRAEVANSTAMTFPILTAAAVAGLFTAAWLLVRNPGSPQNR